MAARLPESHRIVLMDVRPEDYRPLYEIATSAGVRWSWEPSAQGGSYEWFAQRLWDGVHSQFAIRAKRRGQLELVGLVRCYGANFRHQTAQVAVFVDGRSQRSGLAIEAWALFVDWLFYTNPFRKLYAETLAFNFERLSSGAGKYFEVEARLIDHEIHYQQLWDTFILAFEREQWGLHGGRVARHLRTRADEHRFSG